MGESNNALTLIRDIGLPILAGIGAAADPALGRGIVVGANVSDRISAGKARRRANAREEAKEAPQMQSVQQVMSILNRPQAVEAQGPTRPGEAQPTADIALTPEVQGGRLNQLTQTPEGRALLTAAGGTSADVASQAVADRAQETRQNVARDELNLRREQFDFKRKQALEPDFDIKQTVGLDEKGERANFLVVTDKKTGQLAKQIRLSSNPREQTGLFGILRDIQDKKPGAQGLLNSYISTQAQIAQARKPSSAIQVLPDGSVIVTEGTDALDAVTQRRVTEELIQTSTAMETLDFLLERITPETFGTVPRAKAFASKVIDVFGEAFATRHKGEYDSIKKAVLTDNNLFENSAAAKKWRSAFQAARVNSVKSVMLLAAYKIARANDPGGRLSDQDFEKNADSVGLNAQTATEALPKLAAHRDLLRMKAKTLGPFSGKKLEELRGFFPLLYPVPAAGGSSIPVPSTPSVPTGTGKQAAQVQGNKSIAQQIQEELTR